MNNIEVILSEMSLNDLVTCYKEIEQWNSNGVLEDGKVRTLYDENCNGNITQLSTLPIFIYKELSKRYVVNELKINL